MSASSSRRFEQVFGDPVTDLSRQLAGARQDAAEAVREAEQMRAEVQAAEQARLDAEQDAARARHRADEERKRAAAEEASANDARHQRRLLMDANRGLQARLAAFEPSPPEAGPGQMSLLTDDGAPAPHGAILCRYKTNSGKPAWVQLPVELHGILLTVAAEHHDKTLSDEQRLLTIAAFHDAAAATELSKSKRNRLLTAARNGYL